MAAAAVGPPNIGNEVYNCVHLWQAVLIFGFLPSCICTSRTYPLSLHFLYPLIDNITEVMDDVNE